MKTTKQQEIERMNVYIRMAFWWALYLALVSVILLDLFVWRPN